MNLLFAQMNDKIKDVLKNVFGDEFGSFEEFCLGDENSLPKEPWTFKIPFPSIPPILVGPVPLVIGKSTTKLKF